MMQKAADLYDAGDDMGAGEAANMAKYAAAEAGVSASTRPCRPSAATASPASTAWRPCSPPPGSAGSRRSAGR